MDYIGQLIAIVAVLLGTAFSTIGLIGYYRLPDVYTRNHATGKVGVFGLVLLLVAAISIGLVGVGKGITLIVVLMIAGPTVSTVVGYTAYRSGIPMKEAIRDDLKLKELNE
ncbi:MAG: cation:proton antiporter [Chloroflexota bacterium]